MASGPAVFPSTRENTNYARLCRLLVDVGSQALRDTFDRIHSPATLNRILSSTSAHYPTLQSLRKRRILNPTQWGKLYPTVCSSVSSASFDITLLVVLLRNISGFSPPASTGSWDKLPLPGDNSCEANIARIKYYRNEVFAHASQGSVDDATFNMLWQDISNALLSLGSGTTYASAISRLKTECMDPDFEEHYRELLKQWKKDDDNTKERLDELTDMLKKWKSDEGSTKEKLENMEEMVKSEVGEVKDMLKKWKSDEGSTKEKLENMEEMVKSEVGEVKDMLKKWKSDEGSTKEKLENMEEMVKSEVGEVKDMLKKWKSDEGSTKEKLENMEEMVKSEVGEVKEMLTQWKREEGDTKDNLGGIEEMVKSEVGEVKEMLTQWKREEGDTKDNLGGIEEMVKSEVGEVKEMLTQWKREEGDTKDNLGGIEEMVKSEVGEVKEMLTQWKREEGDTKDNLGGIEDGFGPADLIDDIRELYKTREGWLAPFPWCEEFRFHLDNIFTRLKMVSRKKERGTKTDSTVNMLEIFKPHEECSQPRKVLIEGQPGMGKTTYCNKVACDWARNCKSGDSFPDVQVLLLLKCRDINSDLWEAIDDQLLPKDIKKEEREKFFSFVRDHQSKVLLVLDGLDELPTHKLPVYKEIIQGRMLPKCHLVVTARHEAGIEVRECCDTLLEVEGFTENDAKDFIWRYFKTEEHLAKKLLDKLRSDASLGELTANPLNTALLCLLCEDFQGDLPKGRTLLFLEIVACVLKRYMQKKNLAKTDQDPIEFYHAELKDLGCIALNGLLNDEMYFERSAFRNCTSDLISELGFLSVQPGRSKRRPSRCYGFLHKNFQEFFAAFYLSCQLLDEEISPDSLVSDTRYFKEFQRVLMFTCGVLAQRCETRATALIASIASAINRLADENARDDYVLVSLNCIKECEKDQGTFSKELAHTFGSLLEIQTCDISRGTLSNKVGPSCASALATALEINSTLTYLNLSDNEIGDSGAVALAKAMEFNSTLTFLALSYCKIGDSGAVALARAMEFNSSLTELNLGLNEIGDSGAGALAKAMERNSTLTELDLFENNISSFGAEALAKAMEVNSTLTSLGLSISGKIGYSGAAALAKAMEFNSTLTSLELFLSNIGDSGAVALRVAEAMEFNSTLTSLALSYCKIGDSGAVALAKAMEFNSTLTSLALSYCEIGDSGAVALAKAMEFNSTLTSLALTYCKIGDSGAVALAEAMEFNSSLTELHLGYNEIGDSGAGALAKAMERNSTLTSLSLLYCKIGDLGAAALAKAMELNSSLTELDLGYNEIGDSGAGALAKAMEGNSTLIKLSLFANEIGDSGAAALAKAVERNSTLTELLLSGNKIGNSGAAALAEAMELNSTLTSLWLIHNKIDY
ncbi:NLR family CARD domain-containing protein 3-like isoform X1 [Montipora capricornis]|uniref:NLR family CARD domain-containing protein 3-like isoform X1 n=1 Tax=Montipora capricornis TaxID=246305 RepID=UPI0035F1F59D